MALKTVIVPMRVRNIFVILLFAIIHFGLEVLAIANGFIIFRGPETASEIFWDHAMGVLLFASTLFSLMVRESLGQSVLMVLNSLLWGAAFAFVFLMVRKSHRK